MEADNKKTDIENEPSQEFSNTGEPYSRQDISDRKDDDEEEEEEEEEDKIVEKSHNSRFHKRNKRFPKQIEGVDNAFVAIEPKSGKEVIWNECLLSEKKTDKENRYLSLIKKLKKSSHPFLVRFLDAWISKTDEGPRKLVFITERLDECTLKQFLCNSAKNNRLWKRHVGQLLSVLMFLHHLGTSHGNLIKEAIYYQNSGNLKVGPFALRGVLDQKSQASDIYSLGVVALEIAVWTPDFPQNVNETERLQQMLSRLDNNDQKSFIEACLDTTATTKCLIKRLINHPAVTEVPILKLLSARVIVNSISNEEGGPNEPTGFASLLKDYLSHYEDETVIVEIHFLNENLTKSRSWKDFRSNFTLTSKYLEDVKNGFYPLFGCRWTWEACQEEDEELYVTVPGSLPSNGLTSNLSTISGGARNEPCLPGTNLSSGTSGVQSACVSRKHSSTTKGADSTITPLGNVDESILQQKDELPTTSSVIGRSSSHCDQSHTVSPTVQAQKVDTTRLSNKFKTFKDDLSKTLTSNLNGELSISKPIDSDHDHPGFSNIETSVKSQLVDGGESRGQTENICSSASPDGRLESTEKSEPCNQSPSVIEESDALLSCSDRSRRITPVGENPEANKAVENSDLPKLQHKDQTFDKSLNIMDEKLLDPSGGSVASVADKQDHSRAEPEDEDLEEAEEEDDDKDDEDDDNEDDDDDDDDEKGIVETIERFEPQTVHVPAPERAPTHPALFTHCQYFYIGSGRWQVYVQMWFVDDRLKREAYVQVFDYEWHDYERVADLFEASKCINPVDRPTLVRLLALARHNCALIDGELQFPGPITMRSTNFDALELHEKLAALHLHQQAKELLNCDNTCQEANHAGQPTSNACTDKTHVNDSHQTEKNDTEHTVSYRLCDIQTPLVNDVAACADHIGQVQKHQRKEQPQDLYSPQLTAAASGAEAPREHTMQSNTKPSDSASTLFLDVGSLAPRNAYCAHCDTHDYLHRNDLPAYLISPCYHCREFLAKEAKVTPEILLDLHLQHNIPWPAFLQARFNIPNDGRTIEELIAYDCRWRSRQPCRCFLSAGGQILPPCVEFSWLCPPDSVVAWEGNESNLSAKEQNKDSSASPPNPDVLDGKATSTPQISSNDQVGTSSAYSTGGVPAPVGAQQFKGVLPCVNRHPRGAPTTCCYGVHLTVGVSNAPNQSFNHHVQAGGNAAPLEQLSDPQAAITRNPIQVEIPENQQSPTISNGIL